MSVTPYVENPTWADGSGGGTSINAAALNKIEQGITDAHLQPAVRVYHNANQSIVAATVTALAFNSERFDTVGGAASTQHDTATNNSRLTARYAGKYLIGACIDWASGAGNYRELRFRLNGTTILASSVVAPVGGGNVTVQHLSTIYDLAVNDYVEACVVQDTAGALNVTVTANRSPEFWMVRVA